MLLFALDAGAAETPVIRLDYVVDPAAQACPDVLWVKQAVASRLGFDPFVDQADRRIEARIFKAGRGLSATLEVTSKDGASLGRRALSSETGDCLELASSMELAIAIAVDPQYLSRGSPSEEPKTSKLTEEQPQEPLVFVPPEELPQPPPLVEATPPEPLHLHGRAALLISTGLSPATTLGLSGHVRLRSESWSIALEGRGDFTSSIAVGAGRVESTVYLGSAVPCFHRSYFAACAVVSGGQMKVVGALSNGQAGSSPVVLLGARAEGIFPLANGFYAEPFVGLDVVGVRTTVYSGSQALWTSGPLALNGGFALSVRFF